MNTLEDIMEEAMKACDAKSQSDFARKLGVTQPTITNWKTKRSTPDAYALMQLQNILKKDARELLAIIEAERAKTDERKEYWTEIKRGFQSTLGIAMVGLMFAACIGSAGKADNLTSKTDNSLNSKMYIMSS